MPPFDPLLEAAPLTIAQNRVSYRGYLIYLSRRGWSLGRRWWVVNPEGDGWDVGVRHLATALRLVDVLVECELDDALIRMPVLRLVR